MKKYVIFISISLFVIQCVNSDIDKKQIVQSETDNNQTHISREVTYFYESNQVFTQIFDEWKMENVLIFDTLCYWNVLKDDLVLNVLYTIDTTFQKEERASILNDYKIHKSCDIKKMIPYKYHSDFLLKIDSVGLNSTHYTLPYKGDFDRMMFYPPMFTDDFNKCLILEIDLEIIYIKGVKTNRVQGVFVYNEKDEKGKWKQLRFIRAPNDIFDSIRSISTPPR